VNWRRGLVRLGIGATLWWFVFWTCAYAISPASENAPVATSTLSWPTEIGLAIAGAIDVAWIVSGLRRG
jgi:hypothetical protein